MAQGCLNLFFVFRILVAHTVVLILLKSLQVEHNTSLKLNEPTQWGRRCTFPAHYHGIRLGI